MAKSTIPGVNKISPLRFPAAEAYLNDRPGRPVGNNTILRRIDADTVAVTLHGTDVVTLHRGGDYTLRTGGYHTSTTRDRINVYSAATVYMRKGLLHVGSFPLVDGLRVNYRGEPTDPRTNEAVKS